MHVLLGIGAGHSDRALEETVSRAKAAGDDLTIAILESGESAAVAADPSELRARVSAVLAEAAFEADVRSVSGHPGSQLLELAEREGFDRIELDGGETSPMGKVTIGSVAEFVLLNARTTVTLVR
jgi:nucleotide-binding universal stress UspA family protein